MSITTSSLGKQVGGDHYTKMNVQPAEFCFWNMTPEQVRGAMLWNIQKYIWRNKDLVTDLKKAQHYISMWIEYLENEA